MPPRRHPSAENCLWGALPTRIFHEKHFPQKQNEIEDPIPPKMKRSDRCDTIFTPPKKKDFLPGIFLLSKYTATCSWDLLIIQLPLPNKVPPSLPRSEEKRVTIGGPFCGKSDSNHLGRFSEPTGVGVSRKWIEWGSEGAQNIENPPQADFFGETVKT